MPVGSDRRIGPKLTALEMEKETWVEMRIEN